MENIKRSKSIISAIKDGNSLIIDQDQMAVNYFTNLFYFTGSVQYNSMMDEIIL